MQEVKDAILAYMNGLKKSKVYFSDIEKAVKAKFPDMKPRETKKVCTELINDGALIYFSTGSSTMYGIPGKGITSDTPDLD
ncbi:MAG: dissimilatory sulfite reductase D family protein [Bacillota bacterium]